MIIGVGDRVQHVLMPEHNGVVMAISYYQLWVLDNYSGLRCTFNRDVMKIIVDTD